MSHSFGPIEDSHKTLATQVYERIRHAILTSTLKPGVRIDQNQVAETLSVSLAPVREALNALGAEGLVTIIPRRGAFVTEVSLADLDELYFARALIEGETIYHAIAHLSNADLNELQALVDRMKTVAVGQAEDVDAYIALNREFHLRIYSALKNQHLVQTIRSMWERSELYRYRYMLLVHDTKRIHAEHQAILNACKDRDPARAKQAAVHHIRQTQQELHEYLQSEITTHTPP